MKLISKIVLAFIILVVVLIVVILIYSYPNISSAIACNGGGGNWKGFGNTGADLCGMGAEGGDALTLGCECESEMCWNGTKCVPDNINSS